MEAVGEAVGEAAGEAAKGLLLVLGVCVGGTLGTIAAIKISEAFWQFVLRGRSSGDRSSGFSSPQSVRTPCRRAAWRTPHSKPVLVARRRESSTS